MKKLFYTLLITLATLTGCNKEATEAPANNEQQTQKPSKILMVVTSNNKLKNGDAAGYFLPEAIDFYKFMKEKGITVDVASPKGGKAPMYQRNAYINMYKNALAETGLLNKLDSTLNIENIESDDYIAIYYVGGFACLFDFPNNTYLAKLASEIYEKNNGVVAAVCHGPAGLLNIKLPDETYLIKNKRITSRIRAEDLDGISRNDLLQYYFPFILQEELIKREPVFTHGAAYEAYVEVDGRIVTGQGPEATIAVANEVLKLLKQ